MIQINTWSTRSTFLPYLYRCLAVEIDIGNSIDFSRSEIEDRYALYIAQMIRMLRPFVLSTVLQK